MISYTSFNNTVQDSKKSHLEFDKIDETLQKYPYFNVLAKIKENPDILDYFSSEKHTHEALTSIYNLSPKEATLNYNYSGETETSRPVSTDSPTETELSSPSSHKDEDKETDQKSTHNTSPSLKNTDEIKEPENTSGNEEKTDSKEKNTKITPKEATTDTTAQQPTSTSKPEILISASSEVSAPELNHETVDKEAQLTKRHTFSDWLRSLRKNHDDKAEDREKIETIKADWQKKKIMEMQEDDPELIDDEVFDMVISSVTESEEIASEPLAQLYIEQGYIDKAKAVYHKLILKYPEKSSYFAGLIRKLDR